MLFRDAVTEMRRKFDPKIWKIFRNFLKFFSKNIFVFRGFLPIWEGRNCKLFVTVISYILSISFGHTTLAFFAVFSQKLVNFSCTKWPFWGLVGPYFSWKVLFRDAVTEMKRKFDQKIWKIFRNFLKFLSKNIFFFAVFCQFGRGEIANFLSQ